MRPDPPQGGTADNAVHPARPRCQNGQDASNIAEEGIRRVVRTPASSVWARRRGGLCAAAALVVAQIASGCAATVPGILLSGPDQPFRVAGLVAEDGASGVRDNAPAPSGAVRGSDNGPVDRLAAVSIDDITEYWRQAYPHSLHGTFAPVGTLVSYDSTNPSSPVLCGETTYDEVNAFFCPRDDLIAWDRAVMVPVTKQYFGETAVAGLFAHEYGHAIQEMADLVERDTPTLVAEQQADCFAGSYLRWVAEGRSSRFTLSTGDGLNHVLAGAITIRDPVITPRRMKLLEDGHGTALDRVSAVQKGFSAGPSACATISMDEITRRRGDLPLVLQSESTGALQSGQVAITEETLNTLVEILGKIFTPEQPPALAVDASRVSCAAHPTPDTPAWYCPSANTVVVNLDALQKMGTPADESNHVLLQGDDTALSVVTSRYLLALQRERGLPLDSATTALRTACLTGFAQRAMARRVDIASGKQLQLTAGDLDEAVAGLLSNGLVASDVNNDTVPAGFTRIAAFRSGLLNSTADSCYQRYLP
ncbi:Lipoprotein peptidase LpqM [uncultured Mycobacterium sp.]|uniref:Lipoprotein peptidase LpqM n=1 Tax=uncultured Mycobacterium sp. TaxID=171292 RepID=A0A1Y5PKW0_9MYCO|nr:Lipoprotein peptidase LpqM [uncultured Mycobacterium sp.]